MYTTRWVGPAVITGAMILIACIPSPAGEQAKKLGPDAKEWDRVVDKAINYLKSSQDENGGWSN